MYRVMGFWKVSMRVGEGEWAGGVGEGVCWGVW